MCPRIFIFTTFLVSIAEILQCYSRHLAMSYPDKYIFFEIYQYFPFAGHISMASLFSRDLVTIYKDTFRYPQIKCKK